MIRLTRVLESIWRRTPLLTPRLWRTLRQPMTHHPFFSRRWGVENGDESDGLRMRWLPSLGLLAMATLYIWIAWQVFLIPIETILNLFLVVGSSAGGLNAAVGISAALGREREQGRYELVGLTLPGAVGATWAIAARHLCRSTWSQFLHYGLTLLHLAGLLALGISFVTNPVGGSLAQVLNYALSLLIFLLLIRVDYIQTVVLGALLGMVVPNFIPSRGDAYRVGLSAFVGLQLGSIILLILIEASLGRTLFLFGLQADLVAAGLLRLVILYGLRETAVAALWFLLAWQLNTDLNEVRTIARLG